MDKKALMEKLAQESYEKGGFNGAWLYAENGVIVSKGALGFCDPEGTRSRSSFRSSAPMKA